MATGRRRRLNVGVAFLEKWTEDASQAEKNAIYEALFAVSDGSFFQAYKVLDDVQRPDEFFVMVRENLVLKIGMYPFSNFGIIYIGSLDDAPDLNLDSIA
ncbi:MAG TPA: DUF6235 family protein [Pseudonocardiaceae bacterium]|nr:DUF6235 family protein [Pseudonocardiaceae bacterium]